MKNTKVLIFKFYSFIKVLHLVGISLILLSLILYPLFFFSQTVIRSEDENGFQTIGVLYLCVYENNDWKVTCEIIKDRGILN